MISILCTHDIQSLKTICILEVCHCMILYWAFSPKLWAILPVFDKCKKKILNCLQNVIVILHACAQYIMWNFKTTFYVKNRFSKYKMLKYKSKLVDDIVTSNWHTHNLIAKPHHYFMYHAMSSQCCIPMHISACTYNWRCT